MRRALSLVITIAIVAFAFGLWLGALTCKAWGADLPDVRVPMGRVERILAEAGYPAAGYAALEPPAVHWSERLPRGDWGWSVPGTILLAQDQPAPCIGITLAHELAHDATRRMNLITVEAGSPAWLVRAEMERIAAIVETRVADEGAYAPNCLLRRAFP